MAVLLVHAALALAILNAGGEVEPQHSADRPPIELFDVAPLPPPPTVEPLRSERQPLEEGAASPPNRQSRATPVVVPEPAVPVPRESSIVASPTPAEGAEPTEGAAPVVGPGTGAGGQGTGTGSGGAGEGPGGGGVGGSRPQLLSGQFRTRHYPRALQREWETAGPVLVLFDVQLNGRATNCRVYQSSGSVPIDLETCRLAQERLRLRPATDAQGRPVVASYGYLQQRTR